MSQFVSKNPPWARSGAAGLVPSAGSSLLSAQHAASAQMAPVAGLGGSNPTQQPPPAVSASYGTGLAAITLTQSALQQGAMLQQQGIAIPASLAATTQVANVNNGMVVEIARLPQPGVALPTSLSTTQVATVSYPAPRLLAAQYQAPHQTVVQQQPYKHRVFTGAVTKLHENFGFVDDDVFFQISAVKGNLPKTGERVLVEATYNPNMPFKWNATRIQVLPNQVVQLNVQAGGSNRPLPQQQVVSTPMGLSQGMSMNAALIAAGNQAAFAAPVQSQRWQVQQELAVMETLGQQQRLNILHNNNQHSWNQEMEYQDMGPRMSTMVRRHPSPPPQRLRREERRERHRPVERYSPPPARKRSRSPVRRTSRSPPARRRNPRVLPRYNVHIPKISLDLKTGNVMEVRKRYTNLYVPSDFCAANFLWQDAFPPHRPFSMDRPCHFHIVGKEDEPLLQVHSTPDPPDVDYSYSAKVMLLSTPPLSEMFQKACAMPQDGEDGKEGFVHPTRLLSFLVGLKGKNETMAIGGPWSPSLDGPHPQKDPSTLVRTAVRTCKALTGIDLGKCSQWFRFAEICYRRGNKGGGTRVETVVLFVPDVWSCLPTRSEWEGRPQEDTTDQHMEEEGNAAEEEAEKKEPTHFSELDPKSIKVVDLKQELEARNLSAKGLKSQLIARLTKALKTEESEEKDTEGKEEKIETEADEMTDDEKKKEKEDDSSKSEKEKLKNLPELPAVIVQPSRTAKSGKFDCTIMSLSLLLDYRPEDNKEHSFEVSLFAELFNEMMMRDFGFRIYRALVELPEVKDDDKDKKKNEKKDKKDDKEDSRRKDDENDSDKDDEDSEDDDDDDKKDRKKRSKSKKKHQMCTHDPFLLLSCVYYDQTHCGYLLDKDLEELFHTLPLMLSRAQVRKLTQKVCKREVFRYRTLTDRPVDAEKVVKMDVVKIDLEDLAAGNRKYIPSLMPTPSESEGGSSGKEGDASLVSYQGALVDVGKLVDQLERSEKARLDTDEKLTHLQSHIDTLNEASSAKDKHSQKLSHELEDQKQRLRSTEDDLRRTRSESDKFHKTLLGLKESLQSSLFLTDAALTRTRTARNRNKDSDSETKGRDSNGIEHTTQLKQEKDSDSQ